MTATARTLAAGQESRSPEEMKIRRIRNMLFLGAAIVVILMATVCGNVRSKVMSAFNRNRIAIIQCAIGDSVVAGKTRDEELLLSIKKAWPQISVTSNTILDYFRNPVRYVVTEVSNSVVVGVYSAGADRMWHTADDVKREGSLLKDDNDADLIRRTTTLPRE